MRPYFLKLCLQFEISDKCMKSLNVEFVMFNLFWGIKIKIMLCLNQILCTVTLTFDLEGCGYFILHVWLWECIGEWSKLSHGGEVSQHHAVRFL